MNEKLLQRMIAGLESWKENFGEGMERRGADGVSWYDLSINCNSFPHEPELAIIVTSWMGQLKWLKAVLASYRKSGAFVIMAYDNPFYAWVPANHGKIESCMPNMTHYLLANACVNKHITYDSDKRNGWYWNVRYAQGIIRQFPNLKYVYCTNGDCLVEKPEGFKDVISLLGDGDLMSGQSQDGLIHTAAVMYKIDAFNQIFDYMAEQMRVPVIGSRSPEVMLREAIVVLGLNVKHAPKQPRDPADGTLDVYACYGQDSTWKDLLGFRNLFAEYEVAGNEGRDPGVEKYVDLYMDCLYWGGEERETICKFWETGDRRYLYMWLDRWADSDYNRLYTGLDYYSKNPIYSKEMDEKVYRQI